LCERQAQRAIARLEAIGELMIERGVGRGRTSRFVIAGMGGILPPISQEKVTSAPKKVTSAPKKGVENVTRTLRGTVKEESEEETTAIAVAKKPTAARGTRWPSGEGTYPEGKTVPLEWLKEGREWRPDLDMSNQSYLFEDYWVAKPGPNALKLDWRATWRNWVRNAKPDRPVNGHAYGGGLH
jgi:hypothetical protein